MQWRKANIYNKPPYELNLVCEQGKHRNMHDGNLKLQVRSKCWHTVSRPVVRVAGKKKQNDPDGFALHIEIR